MKKVVLYDPSITSLNLGDHVIAESARRHISPTLEGAFQVDVSTHLPMNALFSALLRNSDEKYVLGSNLLRGKMNRPFRQWDINIANAPFIGPAVLVGAGWWQYGDDVNRYTSLLYRLALAQDRLHAVRDEYTLRQLKAAGIHNVVNTGCPTMWDLTEEHCALIPTGKADRVVTTVTDYHKDAANDRAMLTCLSKSYREVNLWLQGFNDDTYAIPLLEGLDNVRLVAPTLDAYDALLSEADIEFVGTRLHAGVRALQHGRRSLILSIDNRAAELSRDFGLPVTPRGDLDALQMEVDRDRVTEIKLPSKAITEWKRSNGLA